MRPMLVLGLTTLVGTSVLCRGDAYAAVQASTPDACTLFTLDEAAKATGRTFRRARPAKEANATTCALIGGTEGNINVTLSSSSSKKDFDEFRKLLTEQGEKLESVTGVGDEAFYWDTRIYVRAGTQQLTISSGDASQPVTKMRAHVLALAKLAAPKLK